MLNFDAAATRDRLPMAALIDARRALAIAGRVVPQIGTTDRQRPRPQPPA